MALIQELILQLHPTDYSRLVQAADHTGQDIGDLIRLAIHRETSAILATASAMPATRPGRHNVTTPAQGA